jgi:hypothetical protein
MHQAQASSLLNIFSAFPYREQARQDRHARARSAGEPIAAGETLKSIALIGCGVSALQAKDIISYRAAAAPMGDELWNRL